MAAGAAADERRRAHVDAAHAARSVAGDDLVPADRATRRTGLVGVGHRGSPPARRKLWRDDRAGGVREADRAHAAGALALEQHDQAPFAEAAVRRTPASSITCAATAPGGSRPPCNVSSTDGSMTVARCPSSPEAAPHSTSSVSHAAPPTRTTPPTARAQATVTKTSRAIHQASHPPPAQPSPHRGGSDGAPRRRSGLFRSWSGLREAPRLPERLRPTGGHTRPPGTGATIPEHPGHKRKRAYVPVHLAARFPRNAPIPSRASALAKTSANATFSASMPSSRSASPAVVRFTAATASGA